MITSIEILKRKYKAHRENSDEISFPISSFLVRSENAFDLAEKSSEMIKPRSLVKTAFNNYVVNIVSAMEVYFRDIVIDGEQWKESGYTNLLKDKIPLSEAFSLFGSEPVTRQYIIAQTSSFKNFDSIGQVFSNLTDTDFYREIENFSVDWESDNKKIVSSNLMQDQPEWRKNIIKLFEVRNQYVHEGTVHKMNLHDVYDINILASEFILTIDDYLDSKFRDVES